MIKSIIKRDGRIANYDEGKIITAVLKALDCQTAHCGRCEQHFIVGAFTSPTVRFGR